MVTLVPAWLRDLTPRQVDLAVTVAVVAATVAPLLLPSPREWWLVALALLASVPVYWRRAAPMSTGIVVGLSMSAMVMWVKPLLPYGPLVCVYTVASLCSRAQRLVAVPFIAVTAAGSLALPHEEPEVYRYMATALVAAYALGTGARARRAQAAESGERARRLAQERDAAAVHERTRIARDVHDIVTHSVGLMVVQAEAGPVVLRSDPARAENAFNTIGDIGRGALVQLRGLLGTLRSGDEAPGLDTLPQLVERIGRTGLDVRLVREGEARPVSAEVGVVIYRVAQEALTNVLRHSRAQHVTVRLAWHDDGVSVEVADDAGPARPSDPTTARARARTHHGEPVATRQSGPALRGGEGYGLVGMRERVVACGGTLRAGPGPSGFVVSAELPVG
ncbi:histidine kinase [Nonomuraea sp. NPDC005983]|uniref:sensor histidine kinase n=1 Tax=Nonomuraea sp. NPDC005983 TaxID=3155595 RepID=UPI0033AAC906